MKLYKYYSPESLSIKSVLENQEIYFSSPLSFNDPFECKPFYRMPTRKEVETELLAYGFMKSSVNRKTREILKVCEGLVKTGFQQYVEKFSIQTGILCLAEDYMNELMWAHYARDHTGLCFEFNLDEFSVEGFSGFEDSDFGAYEAVTYSKDYPVINMLDIHKALYKQDETEADFDPIFRTIYYTKSQAWSYEKEFRAVRTPQAQGGSGLHAFNACKLTGVIFGAKAQDDFIDDTIQLINTYPASLCIKKLTLAKSKYALIESKVNVN